MKTLLTFVAALASLLSFSAGVNAQDVWITPDTPFVELDLNGEFIVIERNQDNEAVIPSSFAKTSRPCPPFCVHPMSAGEGVETVGEIELLDFLENSVVNGSGFLVDARTPSFFNAGTIPGAINLPFNLFTPSDSNPFLGPMLTQLGGNQRGDGSWDFANAPQLLLFCNGPWCDQSPRAIRNLLAIGYPADKLLYYRGGIQNWLMLGLTVVVP